MNIVSSYVVLDLGEYIRINRLVVNESQVSELKLKRFN